MEENEITFDIIRTHINKDIIYTHICEDISFQYGGDAVFSFINNLEKDGKYSALDCSDFLNIGTLSLKEIILNNIKNLPNSKIEETDLYHANFFDKNKEQKAYMGIIIKY
jgi:hypothetical protein